LIQLKGTSSNHGQIDKAFVIEAQNCDFIDSLINLGAIPLLKGISS
jgi:hypothetical protein